MATHDYVIDNQSAPSFRADLNSVLQAIVSTNASATAPATTYANMLWYDTATNTLKKRNEANSGWITIGTFDEGTGTFTPEGLVIASQAEAEAGTNNTKLTTPLRVAQAIAALGGQTNLQVFTASGTYTPSTGYKKALIICTGGGEGGESCTSTNGDAGFGGQAGATALALADISSGASNAVTIGAGGGSSRVNGGTTSVGILCSASGGGAVYAVTGALGVRGGDGGYDTSRFNWGGASFWGPGANALEAANVGNNAVIYGGGGGGALGNGSFRSGGSGAAGVAFILEFK